MTITRFAPSPTGLLHVGNVRTALINYLFTKNAGGKFMLRMDDTDLIRSKSEYADLIIEDLKWLGFEYDIFAKQSDRIPSYLQAKEILIEKSRLYPCFETEEELEIKRKMQLSRGVPPIYDRAALKLSFEQIKEQIHAGKKPHFRFMLLNEKITWNDKVRGEVSFEGKNLSDPILIREDGTMTYILTSVVDDIEFNITDIIRGEDHVTNTAIQVQLFNALNGTLPNFAHLALIKSNDADDAKISKRLGGFDINSLKESGFDPMSINNLFAKLGTSDPITSHKNLNGLIEEFDLSKFGRSPASYDRNDIVRINHKLISTLSYEDAQEKLHDDKISQELWDAVSGNLTTLNEIYEWWKICNEDIVNNDSSEFLVITASLLPEEELNEDSWNIWVKKITDHTGKKGKELFMPLRIALTGFDHGPDRKKLLPLIGRERILKRLNGVQEFGGPKGPEPTRYGDWERKGRVSDF